VVHGSNDLVGSWIENEILARRERGELAQTKARSFQVPRHGNQSVISAAVSLKNIK
jgi:hypothetical protein